MFSKLDNDAPPPPGLIAWHEARSNLKAPADAKERGPGERYLIQHSAGSGKSNSIAWLAHQLSMLHNAQDEPVFDSVVIITDRRVLDRQLQRTLRHAPHDLAPRRERAEQARLVEE